MSLDLRGDLKQQIAQKQVVCFVGAGVSRATAGDFPCTQWNGLLASGVAWVQGLQPELPPTWAADKLRALDSSDTDDLLAVASQVASKLGAPRGGEYAAWLSRTVGALEVADAALIQSIGELGVPIITTNYDHLLEQVLGREAVSWRQESEVDRILRGDSNAILHLHGHYTEPESVVLGLWEYADLAHSEHTQAVMRALGMAKSILFIGFGAGLRDPNFKRFRRWMRRVSHTTPYRHYRLVRAPEAAEVRLEHDSDERITVLAYGEDHDELAPFLSSLSGAPERPIVDRTIGRVELPPEERYDELANLETELDNRLVGEFTVLDLLKKAAAEHSDWSKRSARSVMNALAKTCSDLCNREELEDVYWWLMVYGVLRFSGISRWWGRKRDWEHSVDFAEIAPRGRHLLDGLHRVLS
jgi:hypothetical protein